MVYSNESINEKAEAKELRYDHVRVVRVMLAWQTSAGSVQIGRD